MYELATGNNVVAGMAWDPRRNSLLVATECPRMGRMGGRSDYRPARIPRWATWRAVEAAAKALKEGEVPMEESVAEASQPSSSTQTEDQGKDSAGDQVRDAVAEAQRKDMVQDQGGDKTEDGDAEMTDAEDEEEDDDNG